MSQTTAAAPLPPSLLELIADVVGLLDIEELVTGLLHALQRTIPADWISINDLGPEPESTTAIVDPDLPEALHAAYGRNAYDNPLVVRYQRTLDGRAYRFSDVTTPEELHATALYREVYAPIGLEYQIAFTLPHAPDRLLGVALSRREHDFTDEERALLDRARPFLIQAYRNATEHSRLRNRVAGAGGGRRRLPLGDPALAGALTALGITRREGEVLAWVATGRSDRGVAEALSLSERTVQKHLQHCFAKLGVHSRDAAVARAWALADGAV